jgi:preprotein translocase subunit YajC
LSIIQFLADAVTATSRPIEPIPWYANPQDMLVVLIFGMLIYLFFGSQRTRKKEVQQRTDMLNNMKRGDKVVTAGGIIGTIVDVRDTDVVLKVDESSNTKIKFTRDAIKRVLVGDESPSTAK